MFIFPASLHHEVAPFWVDETRISVSGNVADSVQLNQIKRHAEATIVNNEQMETKK